MSIAQDGIFSKQTPHNTATTNPGPHLHESWPDRALEFVQTHQCSRHLDQRAPVRQLPASTRHYPSQLCMSSPRWWCQCQSSVQNVWTRMPRIEETEIYLQHTWHGAAVVKSMISQYANVYACAQRPGLPRPARTRRSRRLRATLAAAPVLLLKLFFRCHIKKTYSIGDSTGASLHKM